MKEKNCNFYLFIFALTLTSTVQSRTQQVFDFFLFFTSTYYTENIQNHLASSFFTEWFEWTSLQKRQKHIKGEGI